MPVASPDQGSPRGGLRHLSGSILSVGVSRAAQLGVIALTSVVVARIIGASGVGTFAICHAFLLVFTVLVELGLPQAVAYFAGREEWSGGSLAHGLIRSAFLFAIPGAAAILAGFALLGDSLPGITWPMAAALAAALPFSLLWRIGPQAALAQERFEAFALLDSAPAFLLCPAAIAGAALAGTEGAVIGLGAASVASGLAIAAWLLLVPGRDPAARPAGGAPEILRFGLKAWGSELLTQVNLRVELILVGLYAGATESGVFSVALSTTAIAWLVMAAFAVSALPRSARLHAHSEQGLIDRLERDERDARTIRHAVLLAPAVGVAIALLLIVGIPLFYGSAFDRSVGLGLILLPGSLMLGVGMAAVSVLLGRGEVLRVLRVCLAVVPPTVLACLLAIPAGGASAAAIVAGGSYAAFTVLAIRELWAVSGSGLRDLLVPGGPDLEDYRTLISRALSGLRGLQ